MILALETATLATSVALLRGEALVAEWTHVDVRPHSERLLPAVDSLLRECGISIGEVEAFAVSAGPGSFTGLRIGIATVKGLAFEGGRPVAAVPTLAALALGACDGSGPVAALLDARRGEVYAALFGADGAPLAADAVLLPAALAERLPPGTRIVAGEGAGPAAAAVADLLGGKVRVLGPPHGVASARSVGILGARALARGEGLAAARVAPRYVRRAEAEVRRTGARFEL